MSARGPRVDWALALLTWRLLGGRRRWAALLLGNGLPLLVAWLSASGIGDPRPGMEAEFVGGLVGSLVFTALLPLAGLVYGTTAFGQEIEDGTLGYLLAKPTARWRLIVAKLVAAAAATAVSVLPGVLGAAWLVLGTPFHALAGGFTVGILVASLLYPALFMALSLVTRRALLIGLVYVIGWEGALSRVFAGTRALSVREFASTLSQEVSGTPLPPPFTSPLEPSTAVWVGLLMLAGSLALAVTRLRAMELLEEV